MSKGIRAFLRLCGLPIDSTRKDVFGAPARGADFQIRSKRVRFCVSKRPAICFSRTASGLEQAWRLPHALPAFAALRNRSSAPQDRLGARTSLETAPRSSCVRDAAESEFRAPLRTAAESRASRSPRQRGARISKSAASGFASVFRNALQSASAGPPRGSNKPGDCPTLFLRSRCCGIGVPRSRTASGLEQAWRLLHALPAFAMLRNRRSLCENSSWSR